MPATISTNPAKQSLHPTRLFCAAARAAKEHGKSMGIGGARHDVDFQSWLLKLGVRYLISGLDTLYILSGARADVAQIREVAAGASAGTP
ncbi:MAG TPA: hypothetical protein VGC82_09260 [Rhodopila sp.]